MTLGIDGALAIGQYAAAVVIAFFMRFADFLEGFTAERSRQAIRALLRLAHARGLMPARTGCAARRTSIPT